MTNLEPAKFTKQILDFQKTVFDNTFNAMVMIQGQTEKMTDSFLSQNTIIPENGQKMINEWMLAFKKGRDDFKKSVDENFKKMEDFFTEPAKASASKSK